jgi:hypothetical protein
MHERRFSRSGWSDDSHEFAFFNIKRNAADRLRFHITINIGFGNIFTFNHKLMQSTERSAAKPSAPLARRAGRGRRIGINGTGDYLVSQAYPADYFCLDIIGDADLHRYLLRSSAAIQNFHVIIIIPRLDRAVRHNEHVLFDAGNYRGGDAHAGPNTRIRRIKTDGGVVNHNTLGNGARESIFHFSGNRQLRHGIESHRGFLPDCIRASTS